MSPTGKRIQWVKNQSAVRGGIADLPLPADNNLLRNLIHSVGMPTFDVPSPIEEAKLLLQTAAEIEHALMVQYLYAYYSVSSTVNNRPLTSALHTISVQEMGHLMTVQNILLSLGERPYFSRQDLSPQADADPIPFQLEPLSRQSLGKYVAAEAPLIPPQHPDHELLEQIISDAKIASMADIHRVGVIYSKLYWIFQSGDGVEGPWTDFPRESFRPNWHVADQDLWRLENQAFQSDFAEWPASVEDLFVDRADTRAGILEALWRIAAQGEGSESITNSHFHRFLDIYRELGDFVLPEPKSIPTNPTYAEESSTVPAIEDNRISNSNTRKWAMLFDQRYRVMLLCLHHLFRFARGGDETEATIREELRKRAMSEMRRGLDPVARILVKKPRRDHGSEMVVQFAAPPFALSAADIEFPDDTSALWQLHLQINDDSITTLSEIKTFVGLSLQEKGTINSVLAMAKSNIDFAKTQLGTGQ